jgi:hypothetical protein
MQLHVCFERVVRYAAAAGLGIPERFDAEGAVSLRMELSRLQ